MVRIQGEIVVNRPLDEVFDFVADALNEPRYNPRMLRAEKLSPGPVGLGTRFRDEIRSMWRPAEIIIEIAGYQRPRQLTSSIHMSMTEIRGTLAFDPVPGGTRMRWSWDVQPRGVLKLMTPMVASLGQRQEQRIWANLKRFLEAQQAPPISPSVAGTSDRPPPTAGVSSQSECP
jgi:Polyketide cyclase / dehydrase and lipid transport